MSEPQSTALLDERFVLLDALGRGGMGCVVRAFDRHDERMVALKVPAEPECASSAHRLVGEFELWSRLRHRNVVRALGLGLARRGPLPRGTPYLILERFAGVPLGRALPPGKTEAGQLERIARGALSALSHVHAAGLVHRDVKSSNLLVRAERDGGVRLKLTDFGLAAPSGRAGEPGRVSGCLPYLAPEAILGLAVDGRADLYALGVALFRQATGLHPSRSDTSEGILRWHLSGTRPDGPTQLGALPERLARFIVRLLARDRDERPASAAEAAGLLGSPQSAPPAIRPVAGRAELAALRLALDSCGRGARRAFILPEGRSGAAGLIREAAVLAQVRGFELVRLAGGAGASADLTAVTLRLLHSLGVDSRATAERHGLPKVVPISFIGAHPVRDAQALPRARGPRDLRQAARRIAGLLAEVSLTRPFVLLVERSAREDPAAEAVIRELTRMTRPEDGSASGLLVLLPAPSPFERHSISGRSRAGRLGGDSRRGVFHGDGFPV